MSSNALKRTEISIPSPDHVILKWKVQAGDHVQKGETIAIACGKDDAPVLLLTKNLQQPTQTKSTHKRPKRGRRIVPVRKKFAASTSNKLPAANVVGLHQKLAERLSTKSSISLPNNATTTTTIATAPQQPKSTSDAAKLPAKTELIAPTSTASTRGHETFPILSPEKGFLRLDNKSSNTLIVAYIEECSHPAFLDGICVVCGTSKKDIEDNGISPLLAPPLLKKSKEVNGKSTLVTVSGGITMTISDQESRNMALRDSERLLAKKKLSLVLDLDHTLVHATSDGRAQPYAASQDDIRTLKLPIVLETPKGVLSSQHQQTMWMTHYVKLRPNLKAFLNSLKGMYEFTVYTAGTRQYAEEITIVLCRHLVGCKHDMQELEQLRYEAAMTQAEYDQLEKKRKVDDISSRANVNLTSEPAKKKKKVSFGANEYKTYDTTSSADTQPDTVRTLEELNGKLQNLKQEVNAADTLENEAWMLRQEIFGSRVVSRTDVGDLGHDVKSLKRIFPCGGTMAAVVDDREDVWANAQDNSTSTKKGEPPSNLLLVKPYHYKAFLGFADVNNSAGTDLSGGSISGEETDIQLLWTSQILKDLHALYYSQSSTDGTVLTVPELLTEMRKTVLKGTVLVLSGLVPLHKKKISEGAPRPPIVRYAQSLGAQLQDTVEPGVTHVVAAIDGTDKAKSARKIPRCRLVKPAWLVECYWSMNRRRSEAFLINPTAAPAQPETSPLPLQESNTENSWGSSDGDDDDDDDDLAAELEMELMNEL
jgi:RNA polymerase II subunit A-like phosphatase